MTDEGVVFAYASVWIWILALMVVLYVPLVILRCIEIGTGNPNWLYEHLFRRKAP